MEIFSSKINVARAILYNMLLFAASAVILAKCYHDIFLQDYSVLDSVFKIPIIPLFVGIISLLGTLIFGGMTLTFTSKLFYEEPQVIINSAGIEDKRLEIGLIKWNDVKTVMLVEDAQGQWLSVILESLEENFRHPPEVELLLRKINYPEKNDVHIQFNNLDTSIEEVWEFTEKNVIKNREIDLPLAP